MQGILLFAHGARDPAWSAPFEKAAALLQQKANSQGRHVALAFLEFMSPNLSEGCQQLVDVGCTHITVVPLFLGSGGHVRKDVPRLMQEMAEQHPQISLHLSPTVGETDILIQALSDAAWSLAQSSQSS